MAEKSNPVVERRPQGDRLQKADMETWSRFVPLTEGRWPSKSYFGSCHSPHKPISQISPHPRHRHETLPSCTVINTNTCPRTRKFRKEKIPKPNQRKYFAQIPSFEQVSQLPEPLSSPPSVSPQDPWEAREGVTSVDTDHQAPHPPQSGGRRDPCSL